MAYVTLDLHTNKLTYNTKLRSVVIGPGLIVKGIKTSLQEGGDNYYTLEAFVRQSSTTIFEISSSELSNSDEMIRVFAKHQVMYASQYKGLIQDYLMNVIQQYLYMGGNETYITRNLGWHNVSFSPNPVFVLGSKTIGNDVIDTIGTNIKFTNGTYIGQLEYIRDEIIPYKETQLALAMGLSSIVSSLVNTIVEIGTLVVNVTGPSSSGKSTIAEVSASLYGSPITSNTGLVRTFNATKTSIITMCEGRNGLPIILDDANANGREHDKSDLIYQLALGETRARCNSDGTMQQNRSGWSGIAIITSEHQILDEKTVSRGAHVRCITMNEVRWTQDAEHSDRLKAGALANFGHVGPVIADYVSSLKIDDIISLHKKFSTKIKESMITKDEFSDRIAAKLAPILMAAKYFNDKMGKELLNLDIILEQLIIANENSVIKRDVSIDTYHKFMNFLTTNQNRFVYFANDDVFYDRAPKGDVYGKIVNTKSKKYIMIITSIFDKFCRDNNITEILAIKKKWLSMGLIESNEPNRYTVNVKCKEFKARCLKFPFDDMSFGVLGLNDDTNNEETVTEVNKVLPVPFVNVTEYDDTEAVEAIFK